MAKQSGSLHFPFEEDFQNQSLRRAETVEDVIASSIRCFLVTEPGQRRGNPIGSFVPGLLHQLIPQSKLPTIENELKQELTNQFPNVTFHQVSLVQERSDKVNNIRIGIRFSTAVTSVRDLNVLITR